LIGVVSSHTRQPKPSIIRNKKILNKKRKKQAPIK